MSKIHTTTIGEKPRRVKWRKPYRVALDEMTKSAERMREKCAFWNRAFKRHPDLMLLTPSESEQLRWAQRET